MEGWYWDVGGGARGIEVTRNRGFSNGGRVFFVSSRLLVVLYKELGRDTVSRQSKEKKISQNQTRHKTPCIPDSIHSFHLA